MLLDSGSRCVQSELFHLSEASSTAKRSQQRQLLSRLFRRPGNHVLGLWRPVISREHERIKCGQHNTQVWASRTVHGHADGMGWKQQGERSRRSISAIGVLNWMPVMCVFDPRLKVSALGEVTVTLPPKLELHCPTLVVANQSLEVTLVSWGSVGVDVDWKITKEGVQVAKGQLLRAAARLLRGLISTRLCFIPAVVRSSGVSSSSIASVQPALSRMDC